MRRIDARKGTANFKALFPTEFELLTKNHQGGPLPPPPSGSGLKSGWAIAHPVPLFLRLWPPLRWLHRPTGPPHLLPAAPAADHSPPSAARSSAPLPAGGSRPGTFAAPRPAACCKNPAPAQTPCSAARTNRHRTTRSTAAECSTSTDRDTIWHQSGDAEQCKFGAARARLRGTIPASAPAPTALTSAPYIRDLSRVLCTDSRKDSEKLVLCSSPPVHT